MGGMAEIFRAKTIGAEGFEREVAIKRILPHFCEDENFVRMFIDEATIAAKLHHANIVQIFDFDKIDDAYYIAMEFIDGRDFKKLLERTRDTREKIGVWQAVFTATEIAKALHYAHTRTHKGRPLNIVHRDVSPQNLLLTFSGEVKLTDFGIAKAAARTTATRAGTIKGKCAYMSPEQARGKNLDHRSDQFALGVILWEALAYRRLFAGETDFETLSNVLKCDVAPPSSINRDVPAELDKVILKALSKDKEGRHQNCGVFQRELSRLFYANVDNVDDVSLARAMQASFAKEIAASADSESSDDADALGEQLRRSRTLGPHAAAKFAAERGQGDVGTVALQSALGDGAGSPSLVDQDFQATMPLSDLQEQAAQRLGISAHAASQGVVAPASGSGNDRTGILPGGSGALSFSEVQPARPLSPFVIAMLIVGAVGVLAALAYNFMGATAAKKPRPRGKLEAVAPVTGTSLIGTARVYQLDFRVQPNSESARVFVDGKPIEGFKLKNLRKDQVVRVFAEADGRRSPVKQIMVRQPREVVELRVRMDRPPLKQLTISAPGAKISVDGRDLGADEIEVTEESEKVLRIEADFGDGRVVVREVRMGDIARTVIEAPRAILGTLLIQVKPEKAVVDVNGVKLLPTDGFVRVPNLSIGKLVKLVISAKRHKSIEHELVLEDEEKELKFELEPAGGRKKKKRTATARGGTGTVTINAKPWAYVFYKGQQLGMTPLKNHRFPAGRIKLTLQHPLYRRTITVTVREGKHVRKVVNLKP